MKKWTQRLKFFVTILVTVTVMLSVTPEHWALAETTSTSGSAQEYLISFKNNVEPQYVLKSRKVKHQQKKKLKKQNTIVMDLDQTELTQLRSDSNVAFVEPNSQVSIQRDENSTSSNEITRKDALPWGNVAIGSNLIPSEDFKGDGIKVAVLDTGISTHPDLIVAGGVSFVDGSKGFTDDNGHGTHVAGTIAAKDNGIGIEGIAPHVDLYAIKVLGSNGSGTYAQVIQGIEWAIENHMNIITMSFTGSKDSELLHNAIKMANDAGILLVAAAGNQGIGTETEMYPALFPEVISVGATTQSNVRATLSSTGNQLDVVAPGVDIYSTTNDGGYGMMSGTSMAAPHITAASAVIWSQNRSMTTDEIKSVLYNNATPLGSMQEYGHGLVNLARALGIIDSALPPFKLDALDPTQPAMPGLDEMNIAAIQRGSVISLNTTAPKLPSGKTNYTKLDITVYNSSSVGVCSNTYTTSYNAGTTVPSPAFSCSSKSDWLLGKYTVKYIFYYSGGSTTESGQFVLMPESPVVSVTSRTRSSITISWVKIPGVSTYKIIKDGALIDSTSGTNYTVNNLKPSTIVSLQVKAVDPSDPNSGSTSTAVYISTLDPLVAPNAPVVTSASSKTLNVSWNSVSGVSSYKIILNGLLYATINNATSTQISGLNPDTAYSIQVKAVDPEDANSGLTSIATNTRTAKADGPAGFSTVYVTSNSIKVVWGTVSGASSYTISIIKPGVGEMSYSTPLTYYTFAGLSAGTTYTLKVFANNSIASQFSVNTDGIGEQLKTIPITINGKPYTAYPYKPFSVGE